MKRLFSIFLTSILCATASAQTIKTLGYNTTNGQVVANTGTNVLTFTNQVAFLVSDITTTASGLTSFGVSLNFEERRVQDVSITNDVFNWSSGEYVELGLPIAFVSTNKAATTRTNLGLGATWLTNTNVTNFRTAVGLGESSGVIFDNLTAVNFQSISGTNYVNLNGVEIEFGGIAASRTRTNLSLGLPALTNTSNVTMMRALAGSTNTNHPFSGTVDIIDGNMDSHNVTISNGIIVNWQAP